MDSPFGTFINFKGGKKCSILNCVTLSSDFLEHNPNVQQGLNVVRFAEYK